MPNLNQLEQALNTPDAPCREQAVGVLSASSQERTIYQSLRKQLQLGFYDGVRFPSVQEISRQYGISTCPAQRALKMLENDGLIKLCRGKPTLVMGRPYENYLQSEVYLRRSRSLADLTQSLRLISPAISLQAIYGAAGAASRAIGSAAGASSQTIGSATGAASQTIGSATDAASLTIDSAAGASSQPANSCIPARGTTQQKPVRRLYELFRQTLQCLGSTMISSLYYDMGAYIESAYLDILHEQYGVKKGNAILDDAADFLQQLIYQAREIPPEALERQLQSLNDSFYEKLMPYLKQTVSAENNAEEPFIWEPHKGRTRHCDIIAMDMLCKINQGIYPEGALLPNCETLADTYHVSVITIRRTISLMNKLGLTRSVNGIGTRVIWLPNSEIPQIFKDLMLNDNLKAFLEALQLLAITCEGVVNCSFPLFSEESFDRLSRAMDEAAEKKSMVAVISSVMQAVIHDCPLLAIREIYSKITLQLLKGSVLRAGETGREPVRHWQELSTALKEGLMTRNAAKFSMAFGQLSYENFVLTKQTLIDMDIRDIENIIVPV